jgi:hypothetical protein
MSPNFIDKLLHNNPTTIETKKILVLSGLGTYSILMYKHARRNFIRFIFSTFLVKKETRIKKWGMVVLLRIKYCFIDNLDNFAPRDLDKPVHSSKDYKSMATKIQKYFWIHWLPWATILSTTKFLLSSMRRQNELDLFTTFWPYVQRRLCTQDRWCGANCILALPFPRLPPGAVQKEEEIHTYVPMYLNGSNRATELTQARFNRPAEQRIPGSNPARV